MEKELVISSKIENLRLVERFVDEISAEIKLSSELYGNVLIAILEGANNAIVHGNKLNEKLQAKISVKTIDNQLIVRMEDQGKGFDFKNLPDPTAPENIENISGRGVFLMNKLSEKVQFFNNGAIVEMTFRL